MALRNLGTITNLQKMTGVLLATQDANGNPVALSGLPNPAADQSQSVSFANMTAVPNATPANSQFTFDIIGTGVSNGAVTITIQTQQSNGDAGFSQQCQITVIEDPSIPGPPAQFVITAGTIVHQ